MIAQELAEVVFQPVIAPVTGQIVGAEALARSAIAPSAEALFARAASAGLDQRLSRLVQRLALRRAAAWEGPLRNLSISINLLPADIARDGYEQWLLDEMDTAGISPERVVVEITETALIVDYDAARERLTRLRQAGVRVAIDDFGSGYASLAYLSRLPLDIIKIDRELIAHIATVERDRMVVKALIDLVRQLGLTVVVEGVESTGQLALLSQWGCDLYQGFLGAGPLSEEELARFVATANAEAA